MVIEKIFRPRKAAGLWVLEVTYRLTNSSPDGMDFRLVPEVCFTPPTDSVTECYRPQHRVVFDYAGTVVERPVEMGEDGPGVCWSCVEDRMEDLVMGAAWPAKMIDCHQRGMAGNGITLTPVFKPMNLRPGEVRELSLALYAGEGDHTLLQAVFADLYCQ